MAGSFAEILGDYFPQSDVLPGLRVVSVLQQQRKVLLQRLS